MLILQGIHSLLRWLVVLAALITIAKLAMGLLRQSDFDRASRALVAAFGGLMDLQALLGLVLLIWKGLIEGNLFNFADALARSRWEHLLVMLVAVVAAHLPTRWKDKPAPLRTRNTLIAVVVSLALVVVGVFTLIGNRWIPRWPF